MDFVTIEINLVSNLYCIPDNKMLNCVNTFQHFTSRKTSIEDDQSVFSGASLVASHKYQIMIIKSGQN